MSVRSQVDHLVVAARSLPEGIAWCRDTFGFEPASGGQHPLMATHNRVFRIDSPQFPRAYFEIIAVNDAAAAPARTRWFDLDDLKLRESIKAAPRLIHFVASTSDAAAAIAALEAQGIDRGPLVAAERPTPSGLLSWKISVREDGQRLFAGTLPTLIEWGSNHPCDALPASGVALQSLSCMHPDAQRLQAAYAAMGLQQVSASPGEPRLVAVLDTPRGPVRIDSAGI